jgi:hypothetical protein
VAAASALYTAHPLVLVLVSIVESFQAAYESVRPPECQFTSIHAYESVSVPTRVPIHINTKPATRMHKFFAVCVGQQLDRQWHSLAHTRSLMCTPFVLFHLT